MVTINTMGSADTIPLGTDPASWMTIPTPKKWFQYDLGCRVIDAENSGPILGWPRSKET